MTENDFLLACYRGIFARIGYDDESKKWVGRVLDSEDVLVFSGDSLDDVLSTFHTGIEAYIEAAGGVVPNWGHTQTYNMIRYGVEVRPFMELARDFLREEGAL